MALPLEEAKTRWRRLQNNMARADLSGLLIFSNQLRPELIHYVTNYTLLGDRAFAYLGLEGEPVMFISEAWDQERAVEECNAKDIMVLSHRWPEEIAAVIPSGEQTLGVAGWDILCPADLHDLEKILGKKKKLSSATRLIEDTAKIKSPYELSLIREAAKMADVGFLRAIEVLREGLSDYELVAEIDYAMREMGANNNFQMLAVGKNHTGMLLPCGKKVEPADLLLFETTPSNGSVTYSAQLCKTAIFGEPPGKLLLEKYSLLVDALNESLAAIRPGVRIGEVTRIQNEIIGKSGYGEYCRPPYMRARGHGFGLGKVELTEESTLEFIEGMTMVVHPNQFIPETGYLALGESIVITADGIERLTKTESRIYECGGGRR